MDDANDLTRERGIHTIRCSLCVPSVNVYFVGGSVPTLIDTPPEGKSYVNELERALVSIGSSVDSIGRIIVTHPHFDHYGSAQTIRDLSGAEIWVLGAGAHWIERYEEELHREEKYRRDLLVKGGLPEMDIDYVAEYYREASSFGRRAKVSRHLAAGDAFDLNGAVFVVDHVPGHTPFCILLRDAAHGLAFTGDFLPPSRLIANPLVQWIDPCLQGYRATASYVASLKKAIAMNLQIALPGHGSIITDPARRIEDLLGVIEKRRGAVLQSIEGEEKTPFQIAKELFPRSTRESLFRMVADVMGHLEVMEDQGIVARGETEPVCFRRTGREKHTAFQ